MLVRMADRCPCQDSLRAMCGHRPQTPRCAQSSFLHPSSSSLSRRRLVHCQLARTCIYSTAQGVPGWMGICQSQHWTRSCVMGQSSCTLHLVAKVKAIFREVSFRSQKCGSTHSSGAARISFTHFTERAATCPGTRQCIVRLPYHMCAHQGQRTNLSLSAVHHGRAGSASRSFRRLAVRHHPRKRPWTWGWKRRKERPQHHLHR